LEHTLKVTEETKQRAKNVLRFIKKYPWMHNQNNWYKSKGSGNMYMNRVSDQPDSVVISPTQKDVCNTTLCVAGTAVLLNDGKEGLKVFDDYPQQGVDRAADLLGLSSYEANIIFYTMNKTKVIEMLEAVAEGNEEKFNSVYS
jgi:hypothetical protein